jgi:peptidyl-tRNA hydrolase ICT1
MMLARHAIRPHLGSLSGWQGSQLSLALSQRSVKHQAFDASFDPEELAEARKWHKSFQVSSLPPGSTSFSRSSGPGGQHVNKYAVLLFRSLVNCSGD